MTDHEDLIRRLRAYAQERYLGSRCPNLVHEAADAIKELVADLAAARAALREYAHWYGTDLDQAHAAAIEAARRNDHD